LTVFTVDIAGQPSFFSALKLMIANQNQPGRFLLLSHGYLTSNAIASNQFAFFRAPYLDPAVVVAAEASNQTFTIGELFTNGQFVTPAPGVYRTGGCGE
jgi:hypothetical protein